MNPSTLDSPLPADRVRRVLTTVALTVLAVGSAAWTFWFCVPISAVGILLGIVNLRRRPELSKIAFGYAMLSVWVFGVAGSPVLLIVPAAGLAVLVVGLWKALEPLTIAGSPPSVH